MHFLRCVLIFIFVTSEDTLEFTVHGPSAPLSAPLGSSVVLPCYADKPLLTEKVKIVWSKTDSETLVHLYQDGESRPEVQQQDYHDRAHFFTEEIQHGNFSLRLDNLTAQDEGQYRCKVYAQDDADKILVDIEVVGHLLVSGSYESIFAYAGEDVTLNCSVDSHITPEHIEEVSWMKIHKDGNIPVLLYQNNETLPELSHEQFRGRVEFFTAEIPKGNFSLRLKSVRTEDKGVYRCQVFAREASANATVEFKLVGFSDSFVLVLILCIFAIGSALPFSLPVYSRFENREARLILLACLHLCSYLSMLLASITWHFIEGCLYETISCCFFYILGPLKLCWVPPYTTQVPDKVLKFVTTLHADVAFLAVIYSVLFSEHLKKINSVIRTIAIGLLALICLLFNTQSVQENILSCFGRVCRRIYRKVQKLVATCSFLLLPLLQLSLILYFLFPSIKVIIIAVFPVLSVMHCVFVFFCGRTSEKNQWYCTFLTKLIRPVSIVMSGVMVYLYVMLVQSKKDGVGVFCVAGLVQALWMLLFSEVPGSYMNFPKKKIVFLFGSVGVVVVNSAALMTELIMKAVNGERLLGDLRVVVFPTESLFTLALLLLSGNPVSTESLKDPQKSSDYKGSPDISVNLNPRTGESIEMESLRKASGNNEAQEEEIS